MRRQLLLTLSIIGIAAMLGGCALLDSGPTRDSDGQVTESTAMSARNLLIGDCFSFNSADGEVVEHVTVTPCTEAHDLIVIGQGRLTPSTVDSAGSLQNAVSAACARDFEVFKAAVQGDTRPKQEFLVFPETTEPDSDQLYSCVSTDPDQNFIPESLAPESTPES